MKFESVKSESVKIENDELGWFIAKCCSYDDESLTKLAYAIEFEQAFRRKREQLKKESPI